MSQPKYGDPDYFNVGKAVGNPTITSFSDFLAQHVIDMRQYAIETTVEQARAFFVRAQNSEPLYVIRYPFDRRVFGANVIPDIHDQLEKCEALGFKVRSLLGTADELILATHDEDAEQKLYLLKLIFA